MKKTLLPALLAFLLVSCSGKAVDVVRDSTFSDIPGVTIGELFKNRFEDGKWSSEKNSIGQTIVTFQGKTLHDANVEKTHPDVPALIRTFQLLLKDSRPDIVSLLGTATTAQQVWDIIQPPNSEMTVTFFVIDADAKEWKLQSHIAPSWAFGCNNYNFVEYLTNQ